jgi:hypothetical protein
MQVEAEIWSVLLGWGPTDASILGGTVEEQGLPALGEGWAMATCKTSSTA